jgi:hypothetical protein
LAVGHFPMSQQHGTWVSSPWMGQADALAFDWRAREKSDQEIGLNSVER